MIRLPPSSWIWIGVNGLLLVAGTFYYVSQPSPVDEARTVQPRLLDVPAPPVSLAPVVDYEALRNQALFHATRAYVAAPDPSKAGPARPDYQFVAALIMPNNRSIAYVRHPGQPQSRKIGINDDLDGWQVASIEQQRIVLKTSTDTFEIAAEHKVTGLGITRVVLAQSTNNQPTSGARVLGAQGSIPLQNRSAVGQETEARLYRPPQ